MEEKESSGDVIDQPQVTDSSVTTQAEDTAVATPEQVQTEAQQLTLDDRPRMNIDAEIERKTSRKLEEIIPRIVEAVKGQAQPQQQEYTISQLEQFAIDNPHQRPWVEEQKAEIIQKRLLATTEKKFLEQSETQRKAMLKQNVEKEVLSDPRFSEAFVTMPNGQKAWNQDSKLTQLIGQYINDPRIKDEPDALLIAAKLARADLLDYSVPQTQNKVTTLKRQNAQLQNKTMVEGSGVSTQGMTKDPFIEARDQLAKTGHSRDAQVAVKEYLKRIRKTE